MKPCLSIQNPCPMRLSGGKGKNNDFYCKSCKHAVHDFRNSSQEEILSALSKG